MKTEYKYLLAAGCALALLLIPKKTGSGKNTGGLNNPGNIRNSSIKFLGETSKPTDTFKSFIDISHGIRAMISLLNTYRSKYNLNTIEGIISRWAPPTDNNDTDAYINYVAKDSGIKPTSIISKPFLPFIVKAMSRVENRRPVTLAEAQTAYNRFFS